jgi:hypothetical protein
LTLGRATIAPTLAAHIINDKTKATLFDRIRKLPSN